MPGIEWDAIGSTGRSPHKFGAAIGLIGNAVKFVTNGMKVTEYRPDDSEREIDIDARYPVKDRTINQLDGVRIQTSEVRSRSATS